MPSQYKRLAQNLDTLFKPRLSTTVARAAVGYNTPINGVATDLALLYEPSRVTADRIVETTGMRIANGTDLKDLFMSLDTPIVPTFAIIANKTAINETDDRTVTFTIATTDIANGTVLGVTVSSPSDLTLSANSVVIHDNTAIFTATAVQDSILEIPKYFTASVFRGNTLEVTSLGILLTDSSITIPTYTFTSDMSDVNEGETVVFTLSTNNIAENTELFWSANRSDLSPPSGSFIVGTRDTASITATADKITEGSTTFNVVLRSDSPTGPIIATSDNVTINDTSRYRITARITTVHETYSQYANNNNGSIIVEAAISGPYRFNIQLTGVGNFEFANPNFPDPGFVLVPIHTFNNLNSQHYTLTITDIDANSSTFGQLISQSVFVKYNDAVNNVYVINH